jgi:4-amino-4-deoxy-L-arabinose transferase-like glycosyltransferase
VSGAYWLVWGLTFLGCFPTICRLTEVEDEELPLRVFTVALISLLWPLFLLILLIRWRIRLARQQRRRAHERTCSHRHHTEGMH